MSLARAFTGRAPYFRCLHLSTPERGNSVSAALLSNAERPQAPYCQSPFSPGAVADNSGSVECEGGAAAGSRIGRRRPFISKSA
jgi:hypothetical protein